MPKRTQKMAEQADFVKIIKSDDEHSVVIRVHTLLDDALACVIAEQLTAPHALEVRRMSFALKCDLGVALGGVRKRTYESLVVLNRIRNKMAHVRDEHVTQKDARDLRSSVDLTLGEGVHGELDKYEEPLDTFTAVAYLAYLDLQNALKRLIDEKLYMEVVAEDMRELVATRQQPANPADEDAVRARWQARVENKRAARRLEQKKS